jgi:hypothetical protein
LQLAQSAFNRATKELIKRQGSVKRACFVHNRLSQLTVCRDLIYKSLENGIPLTPDILLLAVQSQASEGPRFQRLLRTSGYQFLDHNRAILATRNAHRRMAELSKKNGFQWIMMQYPTGEVGGFHSYISEIDDEAFLKKHPNFTSLFFLKKEDEDKQNEAKDTQSAIQFKHAYVSNSNFLTLASGEKQTDYYLDLFAKSRGLSFGHTTELGQTLISSNVATVIVPLIIQP